LTYEVLSGNTADKTTLRAFVKKIENQYGKADRVVRAQPICGNG
jgi:transposase